MQVLLDAKYGVGKYTVTNLKDLQPGSATARSFCEQLHRRSTLVAQRFHDHREHFASTR